MTPEEMERYRRQMIHPGFTREHQEALRGRAVLLAGIGGLGGEIAYALAGAGVGKLVLVHSGPLTETNMNRQTLMKEESVGKSRVMTAKARLEEYSRFVEVEAHDIGVTVEGLTPLALGVDLVIDARHNFPERRALNRLAMENDLPLLFAAMDGLEAMMALFRKGVTGCLDCLYPDDPPDWDPFRFPVFGAAAHAIGAMAAMEALKLLSGYGAVSDRLVSLSLGDCSIRKFKLRPLPGCRACSMAPAASAAPSARDQSRRASIGSALAAVQAG